MVSSTKPSLPTWGRSPSTYAICEQGDLVEQEGVEALDIAGDVLMAKQVLTVGRHKTPNDHLQRRDRDIARMKAQRNAPPGELAGNAGRAAQGI